jgi:hypothetical protein
MRIDLGTKFRELIADLCCNSEAKFMGFESYNWKVEIWF